MAKNKKKSSWVWYAVKLLFESIIAGEPDKDTIDENFSDKFKLYEEQIVVVKAQSFDHAYKLAEILAKKNEITYKNPYYQTVEQKFVDSLNCFWLFDDEIKSGTEVYSRLFKEPIDTETNTFIEKYFPESLSCDEERTPLYNFLINE